MTLEVIAFVLLTLSTIGLLVIPVTFDKRIEDCKTIISKLERIASDLRDFRFRSTESLKEYDQLNLIFEIYKNGTQVNQRLTFITDNIKERLRDAHRFISTWNENSKEDLRRTQAMSTEELFAEIFNHQVSMANRLNELYNKIEYTNKKHDQAEKWKTRVIVLCIVFNTIGLCLGFISTHK